MVDYEKDGLKTYQIQDEDKTEEETGRRPMRDEKKRYSQNRQTFTEMKNTKNKEIPQESVLGPFKYLLYIQTITTAKLQARYVIFADNTILLHIRMQRSWFTRKNKSRLTTLRRLYVQQLINYPIQKQEQE